MISQPHHSKYAQRKAMVSTALFILVGLVSIWQMSFWAASMPLIIFYFTLIVNTYFSIRCFADLVPRGNLPQQLIDLVLGAIYIILAFNLSNQLTFILAATLLFAVATLKYILLFPLIGYSAFLQRKIFIDCLGIIACALALGAVLLSYGLLVSWLWAIIFIIANIYLLFIKPMYNYSDSK